jgi:malonate transporter and related proteins
VGGVLIGFGIIAVVIVTGYAIARFGVIGPEAHQVLSRLAFFVLSPALLFTVLAEADLRSLFSVQLPVAAIAAVVPMAIFLVVALVFWRRKVPEATIGALASGYLNANNIGIPVAAYVVGDAAASAPVILLQLIVFAPVALTVLDITTSGKVSLGRILSQPVRNPLIIGSVLGLVVAVTGIDLPAPVLAPFELVGAAAVPIILINFGMSLHGRRMLDTPGTRRDVVLAVVLKLLLMPLVAWAAARYLFGLEGHALFVAVVLAALPTAQNVFNYAVRYRRGEALARDAVLLSTLLSLPVIVIVAALLFA